MRILPKLSIHCDHDDREHWFEAASGGPTNDRSYRGPGRSLGADRFQGDQRSSRCVARDPQPVEAAIREQGVSPVGPFQRAAPILERIFHESESEWALEIVRGVEQVAGRHHMAVVLSELHGRRTPGRGWIEGVLPAS